MLHTDDPPRLRIVFAPSVVYSRAVQVEQYVLTSNANTQAFENSTYIPSTTNHRIAAKNARISDVITAASVAEPPKEKGNMWLYAYTVLSLLLTKYK